MDIKFYILGGTMGAGRGRYPFRKIEKITRTVHILNQILRIFSFLFFFVLWWILTFLHTGGGINWAGKGPAEGAIRSEKQENYKNWTHTKIKFPIIFIQIFFFVWWIYKIFLTGGGSGRGLGGEFFIFLLLFHQCNNISIT